MAVVGVAKVGVARGLRVADLPRKFVGPFRPGEEPALVQLNHQREGMRFPWRAKDRLVCFAAR